MKCPSLLPLLLLAALPLGPASAAGPKPVPVGSMHRALTPARPMVAPAPMPDADCMGDGGSFRARVDAPIGNNDPAALGPKQDDPAALGPKQDDPAALGPKQDDPVALGPKQDDPVALGPKQDDPAGMPAEGGMGTIHGGVARGPVLAVGPKQDDPTGLGPKPDDPAAMPAENGGGVGVARADVPRGPVHARCQPARH